MRDGGDQAKEAHVGDVARDLNLVVFWEWQREDW